MRHLSFFLVGMLKSTKSWQRKADELVVQSLLARCAIVKVTRTMPCIAVIYEDWRP